MVHGGNSLQSLTIPLVVFELNLLYSVTEISSFQVSALEHLDSYDNGPSWYQTRKCFTPTLVIIRLVDFGISGKLSAADARTEHRYDPIEGNGTVADPLPWCSINAHLAFGW